MSSSLTTALQSAVPGLQIFERGKATDAQILSVFQTYKANFSLNGTTVRPHTAEKADCWFSPLLFCSSPTVSVRATYSVLYYTEDLSSPNWSNWVVTGTDGDTL